MLLVLFGAGADFHTNSLIKKNNEKYAVYKSMLRASHHILNNFLQGSKLFQMEADESKDFDRSILKQFDELIVSVTAQVRDLEGIQEGMGASAAYLEAIHPDTREERRQEIEEQLLKYCCFDTEAMVQLVKFFETSGI